jgi:hypothetical protein
MTRSEGHRRQNATSELTDEQLLADAMRNARAAARLNRLPALTPAEAALRNRMLQRRQQQQPKN